MNLKVLTSIFFVFCFFLSCSKDDPCSVMKSGTFVEPGFSGCEWLIKLENNSYLEPVNLKDFDISPSTNLEILFNYHQSNSFGSYCQFGEIVEIEWINLK